MLLVTWLSLWIVGSLAPSDTKAAAQAPVYRNLQVLTGVPAERIRATMDYVRASLGVSCWHCHVQGDFASDTKAGKRRARDMMRMVREINDGRFDGDLAVSCFTCHRGALRPSVALPVFAGRPDAARPITDAPLPPVADVLRRYTEASGGEAAWRGLATWTMTGAFETSEPASYPLEIMGKAPDRYLSRYMVGQSMFADIRNGDSGWRNENSGGRPIAGRDLQALRARGGFHAPYAFADRYQRLQVLRRERIDSVEMIVVAATTPAGAEELVYFDGQTGLLARIDTRNVTPLGAIAERLTFEDYRRVDGVLLPFRMTRADAQYRYVQRIETVRHDVPLDDALFEIPGQVEETMRGYNRALGVECVFCHVQDDWKNESRAQFATARGMAAMVRALNGGPLPSPISCVTCHAGQSRPSRLPIPVLTEEEAKWPESLANRAGLKLAMSVYNVTLGVGCDHCHDPGDWTSDAKPAFQTAVRMGRMFDLFPKYMPPTARTQCWMCHKGSVKPK